MKILGTFYLLSEFKNSDGTIVTDHPLVVLGDEDYYYCFMFTTSSNKFTTKNFFKEDISFLGCSNHSGEKIKKRFFQAECYVLRKNDFANIKRSEYKFASINIFKSCLSALERSIQIALETNFNFGIMHMHYFNSVKEFASDTKKYAFQKFYKLLKVEKYKNNLLTVEPNAVYKLNIKKNNERVKKENNTSIILAHRLGL